MFDSYEDSEEWAYKESIADSDRHEDQRDEFAGYSFDHAELQWQRATFLNVADALRSGLVQRGRDGKKYVLDVAGLQKSGMSNDDIDAEARMMASLVVG